jgi:hypothetical protein
MKKLLILTAASLLLLLASIRLFGQSVGIGTTSPHASALLDMQSTNKGILIPRMTQAEINAIASPAQGLMVFNTNSNSFQYFNGSLWHNITHSGIVTGSPNKIPRFIGLWGLGPGLMMDNLNGVSINTVNLPAHASAIVDIASTTKGLLIPRMTTAERVGIATPANGLLVFDSLTQSFWFNKNTGWTELGAGGGGGGGSNWTVIGNDIYNSNSGNVGIGASSPFAKLTVDGNIVTSGGIGIATTTPDLLSYKLDVNGSARTRVDQYVNRDLWVDRNFDVDGTSNLFGNIVAGSNVSISGSITSVDNVNVTENVTVDGGKGIVRSTNGNQRVVAFPSGGVGYTNAPAGYTDDVEFVLPNVFSSNPVISLGNVTNQSGTFERWTYTIHSINLATNRFTVRFYNASSSNSTFSCTFNFIAIGTAL